MNSNIIAQLLRAIFVLLIQILVLKNVEFTILDRFSLMVFLYPVIILLFPIEMSRNLLLSFAFFSGLLIDMFYNSPGLHSATFVFTAFFRTPILKFVEPRGGYRIESSPLPSNYGLNWFLRYSAICTFLHCLVYFMIDAFTLVYLDKILASTIFSFICSYIIILIYTTIFRSR